MHSKPGAHQAHYVKYMIMGIPSHALMRSNCTGLWLSYTSLDDTMNLEGGPNGRNGQNSTVWTTCDIEFISTLKTRRTSSSLCELRDHGHSVLFLRVQFDCTGLCPTYTHRKMTQCNLESGPKRTPSCTQEHPRNKTLPDRLYLFACFLHTAWKHWIIVAGTRMALQNRHKLRCREIIGIVRSPAKWHLQRPPKIGTRTFREPELTPRSTNFLCTSWLDH